MSYRRLLTILVRMRLASILYPLLSQSQSENACRLKILFYFTGSNWKGFPFLFALCTSASLVIWFGVDIQKGRRDAVRFAAENRVDGMRITAASVSEGEEGGSLEDDVKVKS